MVHDRGMPHLALLARLYHGVVATSCQSERNFSALSFLIAHLRSSIAPFKAEQIMFLHLNQDYIPEFHKYKGSRGISRRSHEQVRERGLVDEAQDCWRDYRYRLALRRKG